MENKTYYVGAQNDQIYIITGAPPSADNDYPNHDADRTAIAKVYRLEDARRIAACLNACKDFDTETLELAASGTAPSLHEMFREHGELWGQRDKLLAALKTAHQALVRCRPQILIGALVQQDADNAITQAQEVIAAVEQAGAQ